MWRPLTASLPSRSAACPRLLHLCASQLIKPSLPLLLHLHLHVLPCPAALHEGRAIAEDCLCWCRCWCCRCC